jgi:hypothetical protein
MTSFRNKMRVRLRSGFRAIKIKFPRGAIAGAISGIVVTLLANVFWESYTSPQLDVRASVAVTNRSFRNQEGNATWRFITKDAVKECTLYEVNAISSTDSVISTDSVRFTWRMVLDNHGSKPITDLRFLFRTTIMGNLHVLSTPTIDFEVSDRSFAPVAPREALIKVKSIPPQVEAVLTVNLDAVDVSVPRGAGSFLTLVGSNEIGVNDIDAGYIGVVEAIEAEWRTVGHSEVFLGDLPASFSPKFLVESAGNPKYLKDTTCPTPHTPWPYSLVL